MGAAPSNDWMHSQREAALKPQRIKQSFLRDAKNCLARYVRNYAVRSARSPCGKPIKAESWELILARGAMRLKLRDDSRLRNDLPVGFRQRLTTYVIMATKTGPHAVSTILPIA
jgi:hypothetical protein